MSRSRGFLSIVFGRWQWEAPEWLRAVGSGIASGWRYLRSHPPLAIAGGLSLVAIAGGLVWYLTRPSPHYVTYVVNAPELTTYNDNGTISIKPMTVVFSESAAPLKLIKKPIATGIDLSPALAGTWYWLSDRELQFTPGDDWPVDGSFKVRLNAKAVLASQVLLESYSFKFASQPFTARIAGGEFYQDPVDPNLKKVVTTVAFSHPVDPGPFESHVSLLVEKDAAYLGLAPNSRQFTVVYDKFKLKAFVHSVALAMPRDDTHMTVRVEPGVRAARGGNDTPDRLETSVTIPGRASLRFSDARMTVVDNARFEPEQVLLMKSSSPVAERAFAGKVVVRLLPVRHPKQPKEDTEPYNWFADNGVGEDILSKCENVTMSYLASDDSSATSHGFKFGAPVGRYVHVLVQDNVQGIGGYVSGKPYVEIVKVDPYPRALRFLGDGALLSPSGERKVGYLTRDIDTVQVVIGRVLPNQLQHLSHEMWDFARPDLYDDLEARIVERFVTNRDYSGKTPGRPTYDSVDLGQYLNDATGARRGLFLLHIRAVTKPRSATDTDAAPVYADGGDEGGYRGAIEDTRLVLITDLGFFVKRAKDGSRDVFVQSIRTGLPVAAARVSLLGMNGLSTMTSTTDAAGKASFPAPPRDLPRDKQPQVVLVERDQDWSFMPFRTGNRALETSRFDVGGVENPASARQLSAYLFSDRGIYRPGETAHLGMITRSADWQSLPAGLPLLVEITDPRGQIVQSNKVGLSAGAFDELTYNAPIAAPTGTYQVVTYVVKDDRHRDSIGMTTFRVQEFEPDRLKVQLDLTSAPIAGWLRPDDVHARITVAHLFGEAAGGRRVEGEMTLTPVLPRFTKWTDYRFQVGEAIKEAYHEPLSAQTTDAAGTAEFPLDLRRFIGRAYRLNVLGRAFEAEGGRNVAAQNGAIVSEAQFLVGVKSDGDLTFIKRGAVRQSTWLAVDQQLTPVPARGLTLEWVQRKYVSVLTQQDSGLLKYVSKLKEIVRSSRDVQIVQGGTAFKLPTDEPGDFMLVLRDATGAKLNSIGYTVAGDANVSRSLERDAELQIQLDRPSYRAGDTIAISIRAPYAGAGLITIERDRVYRHVWFKTATTSSVQRITLPADFDGNGYVTVQFVRDPTSDDLFISPLSYGIAAFGADLGSRTESLTVTAPKTVKPGTRLTIHVAPEEASSVAVLAVDEGILQVARYRSPDPLGYFFQKKMLEVSTSQVLDLILPDFARYLALAAPGGDMDAGFSRHLNPFARKRKAPAAYWSGIVPVGREGKDLTFTVPDYFNGRLRIVAIAVSPRRLGVGEISTEVKGDFILTPNLPAAITPGDEFIVSVGVFNNTTGGTGAVRLAVQLDPGLTIVGPATADLTIADKKEAVGEFRLKADAKLGSAALRFTATRAAAESRIEETVGIRPATTFRTQLSLGRVDGGSATAPITRSLYREKRIVEAAISTTPLVWSQGLIAYLDHYEYTCTEQLVSKGFSGLIVLTRPEFGKVHAPGDQTLAPTFAAIRGRQNDQGGLGLWSSTPDTAEFATLYGAHFLIEARDHGQQIPPGMLDSLDAWMTRFATTPANTIEAARLRAYAVYLLTRQGIKPIAAISNVEQELTQRYPQVWKKDLAAAYLASTYKLMQRDADADALMKGVPWAQEKRDFPDEIYYGASVHDAQLLYLTSRHFGARIASVPAAALENMSAAAAGFGSSSLSAAYTLLALDAFAKTTATTTVLGINEKTRDKQTRALELPAGAISKVPISEAAAAVEFTRRGSSSAYYVLAESGFDRTPPPADLKQGVEIIREFVDDKGNVLSRVTVGQDFFVRIRVRAMDRDRQPQIAIVDLLPGGVEPVLELQPPADSSTPGADPAMAGRGRAIGSLPIGLPDKSDWTPSHIDVRDDRVVLYGDATRNAGTFTYRVRADNAGTYQVPPAFAEGMYNRTVVALSRAMVLEVIKP